MTSPTYDVDIMDCTNPDADTVCSICLAEFLDAEDLKIHLEQMHNTARTFTLKSCHFCESSYSDIETFCYHLLDEHISVLKRCKYCSKIFTDAQKQRDHEKKHKNKIKSLVICSQCSETFTNCTELQSHEFDEHANDIDGVTFEDLCPHLSSILNINFTTFTSNIGSDTAFTCLQCNFNSYDMDAYIKHLQTHKCRSLACNKCGNIYKHRKGLVSHFRCNTSCSNGTKDNYVQCKECNKKVKILVYKDHVKHCKIFKCLICDIVFETMIQLSEHQSYEHPLSVDIKHCKFCFRECVGTVALRKHIERTHKEDFHLYKYMCMECKEIFKHPQKLFTHYFMKHKELHPYTCKICDKNFRIRKKFTLHIKLEHKSVGFVEFDENYHVYFVEEKSENPFVPTCVINDETFGVDMPGLTSLLNKNTDKKNNLKAKTMPDGKTITVNALKENEESLSLTSEMPTETEGNVTEIESKPNKLKRKWKKTGRPSKRAKKEDVIVLESSDDDEPLQTLKNKQPKKKNLFKNDQTRFTCKICNKYCYTYQNYHNHMNLHSKNEKKTCVKCSREFKSSERLEKHMKTDHSSSKLTEYLKNILEKRKKNEQTDRELSLSEKFQHTIKKVKIDHFSSGARIKALDNGQSVKNFIESFTPEEKIIINNTVTVKAINTPFYRQPVIKMKKYEPINEVTTTKLAMPVKCVRDNVKTNVTVKLVQGPVRSNFFVKPEPSYNNDNDYNEQNDHDNYDSGDDQSTENIPDVADEVMIENEEPPPQTVQESKPVPRTIIIDNIPKNYSDISIAHLQPEAPYFKIVKVNKILKMDEKEDTETQKEIELPNGTKLVTVNPLAHLLGDKPVDEVFKSTKNKYYKPKPKNFENLLKKALLNLESGPKYKYKKKSTKVEKAEN